MRGSNPQPRTGMFVFYLLNLFRELNSSDSRTRTETVLSDQRIDDGMGYNPIIVYITAKLDFLEQFSLLIKSAVSTYSTKSPLFFQRTTIQI